MSDLFESAPPAEGGDAPASAAASVGDDIFGSAGGATAEPVAAGLDFTSAPEPEQQPAAQELDFTAGSQQSGMDFSAASQESGAMDSAAPVGDAGSTVDFTASQSSGMDFTAPVEAGSQEAGALDFGAPEPAEASATMDTPYEAPSNNFSSQGSAMFDAAEANVTPRYREWQENHDRQMEEKKASSEAAKNAALEQAKEDLQKHYAELQAKKTARAQQNRDAEQQFIEDRDANLSEGGSAWEKAAKWVNLQQEPDRKDISRFQQVLIRLKGERSAQ